MIKLAYCNVENLDLKRAYDAVPKDRQDKINFFRFEKDKKLSAGAYLLLKKLLSCENITNPIFKTEKYIEGLLIPFIEYEIFNQKTKEKLNINVCKDKNIKITITTPVSINESILYKYLRFSAFSYCFSRIKDSCITIVNLPILIYSCFQILEY